MNVKIIGLGGIGSLLADNLCRFINYKCPEDTVMTFVDGDTYELKNHERQSFKDLGNKADIKAAEMKAKFPKCDYDFITQYVTMFNIASVIHDGDIVFMGVDNHKTRKVVNDHCKTLENVVLISGGNEYTDGNVQVYVRKGGKDVNASLADYHPEIADPKDKSPDEMSCEELSVSEPQLLFTNLTAATIMCWVFYKLIEKGIDENVPSEVYFDIHSMAVAARLRKPLN